MMEYELNPDVWFNNRRVTHNPAHFIISRTPLTKETLLWIINSLTGRYAIVNRNPDLAPDEFSVLFDLVTYPTFEDPKEAMLYELKWA